MTDPVLIAIISTVGMAAGGLAKTGVDRLRNNGADRRHAPSTGNGNGNGIESVIARRAEVEFQTRMTLVMSQLTDAITKGHDKTIEQMTRVGEGIADAAGAMREVHAEIVGHRECMEPVIAASLETARLVRELHAGAKRT